MVPLYILGSGGFSKEVYFLIDTIKEYDIKGFVDIVPKDPIRIGKKFISVFPESVVLDLSENVCLAIGVGSPDLIQKLVRNFSRFRFPNLIHPSVIGNFEDIVLGTGNVITANCIFTTSIQVGSFNVFNLNVTVGHDVCIGDCNVINPGVNISGGVKIGNQNLLGVNSTILQYKTIGNETIVGANSLVNKNVENRTTVVGVPAKPLHK